MDVAEFGGKLTMGASTIQQVTEVGDEVVFQRDLDDGELRNTGDFLEGTIRIGYVFQDVDEQDKIEGFVRQGGLTDVLLIGIGDIRIGFLLSLEHTGTQVHGIFNDSFLISVLEMVCHPLKDQAGAAAYI